MPHKTPAETVYDTGDFTALLDKALAFMNGLTRMPEKVQAYFRHPAALYAAS